MLEMENVGSHGNQYITNDPLLNAVPTPASYLAMQAVFEAPFRQKATVLPKIACFAKKEIGANIFRPTTSNGCFICNGSPYFRH